MPRRFSFILQVKQVRDFHLHPEGQLVVADGGFDFAHLTEAVEYSFIELPKQAELPLLQFGTLLQRLKVGNRMFPFAEERPLIGGRQKAAAE